MASLFGKTKLEIWLVQVWCQKKFVFLPLKIWGCGGLWEQESINKIYTKKTRMRILIPWSTDRLSSQSTDLIAQVCQSPILQGCNPAGTLLLPGGKLASTGASENHFPPGRTENLVGFQSSRPRIPHPCCSPFFFL